MDAQHDELLRRMRGGLIYNQAKRRMTFNDEPDAKQFKYHEQVIVNAILELNGIKTSKQLYGWCSQYNKKEDVLKRVECGVILSNWTENLFTDYEVMQAFTTVTKFINLSIFYKKIY